MASTTVRKNQKNLRKMTLTDKEKIDKAWKAIDRLIGDYDYDLDKLIMSNQPAFIDGGRTIKDLEKIKKILEK